MCISYASHCLYHSPVGGPLGRLCRSLGIVNNAAVTGMKSPCDIVHYFLVGFLRQHSLCRQRCPWTVLLSILQAFLCAPHLTSLLVSPLAIVDFRHPSSSLSLFSSCLFLPSSRCPSKQSYYVALASLGLMWALAHRDLPAFPSQVQSGRNLPLCTASSETEGLPTSPYYFCKFLLSHTHLWYFYV